MLRKMMHVLITVAIVLSQMLIYVTPVYATDYPFNNGLIRFDQSSSSSINTNTGNLNQPFYFNGSSWYKLTFSSYPLNFAIAEGNDGANSWNLNGTILTDPNLSNLLIDNSNTITSNGLTYGTMKTSGTVSINGKTVLIENTFELGENKSFVKITTKFTNTSESSVTNFRYWVGTQDDYVGTSDRPNKLKGNIVSGVFTPIATQNERSSAIQITSGSEGVLFYTDNNTTNMAVNDCCSFENVVNQDPNTSNISVTSDGSYAMFMRLNDLATNQSQSVTWYYAAGRSADLANIVRDVASAATSFTNITFHTANFTVTSSVNSTGYYVVVPHGNTAPTADQIIAGVDYSGGDVLINGTQSLSANVASQISLTGLAQGASYDIYFVTRYTNENNEVLTTSISASTLTLVAYGAPILSATGAANSITKTSATVSGEVSGDNSEGTANVTDRGFCYSTTSTPNSTNGTCFSVGSGLGSFSADLTELLPYTTYYVRSYATNSYGTGFGAQSSFRTLERTLNTALSGLNVPVTGTLMQTRFNGTGYSANVVWSPASSDGNFHAGISYTATLTITPTTGYDLIGILADSFTLNGVSSLSHEANSGVISLRYPATVFNQVIYDSNEGSSVGSLEVDFGENVPVPNDPVKRGYAFDGWYTDEGTYLNAYDFNTALMPNHDLSLYAKWVVGAYTLSYESNGGSYVESVAQNANTTIEIPPNPSKEGYQFAYWSAQANLETPYVFSTMPADNLTLYAKWNPIQYEVVYQVEGGNDLEATRFTIVDAFTLPIPSRQNYTFTGWFIDGQPINSVRRGTQTNLTVVATWQRTPQTPVLGELNVLNVGADSITLFQNILNQGYPVINSLRYELKNLSTGEILSAELKGETTISGLLAYQNYELKVVASNGLTELIIEGGVVMPRLSDQDNDGVPDVRDAYPDDSSKSMDVSEFNPEQEPVRALIGEKPNEQATQYQLKISLADVMGLERNDNILVVMGSVQFVIPVAMVDSIIANTGNPEAYLTLRVEPQIGEDALDSTILLKEGMDLVQAYDYALFQIYPDGSEEAIHELGGKIKVGIGLGELQGEYDPTQMEVYYYNSETETIQSMKAVYDPVTQSMVFLTEHFSYYVLGIKKGEDPSSTTLKVLGLFMAILIALTSGFWWIFKKRKAKA